MSKFASKLTHFIPPEGKKQFRVSIIDPKVPQTRYLRADPNMLKIQSTRKPQTTRSISFTTVQKWRKDEKPIAHIVQKIYLIQEPLKALIGTLIALISLASELVSPLSIYSYYVKSQGRTMINTHRLFVDYSPIRNHVFAAMFELEIPAKLIKLSRMTLRRFIEVGMDLFEPFDTVRCSRQGCRLSYDYNFVVESILRK